MATATTPFVTCKFSYDDSESLPFVTTPHSAVKPISKCSKHTNSSAVAISEVTSAINTMAASIKNDSIAPSPVCHATAINLLDDDGDVSDSDQVQVIHLFSKNVCLADTYVAIPKKSRCTAFIHAELDALE